MRSELCDCKLCNELAKPIEGVGPLQGLSVMRCAVIGVGRRTLKDYVPALVDLSARIDLIAACDVDAAAEARLTGELNRCGSEANPSFFTDHTALLDTMRPDLAIVATPHHTHNDISKDLFRRGIPVVKEKPFALSMPQARELTAAVEEYDGHMRLCVQRRYHPLYLRAKSSLQQIGATRHFEATYQLSTDAYQAGWRASSKTSGGGAIIDMGYHIIDLLHWFFGMPSLVYASAAPKLIPAAAYDVEETTLANLSYPNGVTGTLRLSLCEASKEELIRVYGSGGHIRLTRDSLQRFDRSNHVVEQVVAERSWNSASGVLVDTLDNLANPDAVQREMRDGVRVTATIEALYRSIAQQTAVKPLHEEASGVRFGTGDRRGTAGAGPEHGVSMAEAAIGMV
ncbi:Gfo/Idh/MocA family protein [Streptomyces sp. NPDC058683]|uniref:Gfo/Idh/MocA family protein n=1 Tax=Streptomyces sp. NPDC058683 TaxID=3346597 RepID=UPI00364AACAA